ncbi:MAG TPA: DUF971 domain-containing protein [Ignavibacteriaceae bacterium]|nr:DUF971 domain-containing protein [Ignavibacteriaceae bacterium]
MQPRQIKIKNKENLVITWNDDKESSISLKYLRDECPCANCKGETVLLKTYRPPKSENNNPEMYKIKNIETVGGYAIQVSWKDGHDTGIYSWDYLTKLENDQLNEKPQNYTDLL